SSFEVVRRVRRALKARKAGHGGTLDPFATGLLLLCIGEATKLVPFLMPEPKTYRAVAKLGEETDTQDPTGEVVARSDKLPEPDRIYEAAARFLGEIEQIPPMYSALRHHGERLYRLARRGETVEVKPRKVTIYRLEVQEVALPLVTLEVTCSQGTYIRTLAADLGRALGCGAHLAGLRRLAVGPFKVEEALTLEAMREMQKEELASRIIPLAECLPGFRALSVGPEEAELLRQGRALPWPAGNLTSGERVRLLAEGKLLAVAEVRGEADKLVIAPVRVFGIVSSKQAV
ncbi:MAG: tRNA pseudouridine(55) synthase TruB, partial [Deltaproteobacteria bacterium]|nr:tRNA pseudouridine(55) synthase TruB [Deltaproteobacteria bacterium]